MKQYVVTDEEFEELLRTLELHKFNGAASLQTSVAIEIKRAVEEMEKSGLPGTLTKQTTDFVMADAY